LRYTLGRTELLDAAQIPPELQLDIDRLFPQVRLSTFSSAIYRDTRDDPLEPARGFLLAEDSDLSMRAIGSQVGFAKFFVQAFMFRTVVRPKRIVFASAFRLGVAHAFAQEVFNAPVPADMPASERFFAGGSTTVRGFALDRLGTDETISPEGFPRGGNGVLILNAELRVPVLRDLGVVGFMDAGNVYARASDIDLGELRFSPGMGLRYRSPIGPIRFDVGFKLNRRELSPGRFEAPAAFHLSVGHAF
jgi:outer membrane protein insertion porin family